MTDVSSTQSIRERIAKQVEENTGVRKNFQKETPPDGFYKWVIVSQFVTPSPARGDKEGNGAGCRQVAVHVAPLADPEDPSSVQMQYEKTVWHNTALVNPEIEDHKVSFKAEQASARELAAFGVVEHVAAKDENGNWINNSQEYRSALTEQLVQAAQANQDLLDGKLDLTNRTFYAKSVKGTKEGQSFINSISRVLPAGQTLSSLT